MKIMVAATSISVIEPQTRVWKFTIRSSFPSIF